jgi:ATP-dependent Zn protease
MSTTAKPERNPKPGKPDKPGKPGKPDKLARPKQRRTLPQWLRVVWGILWRIALLAFLFWFIWNNIFNIFFFVQNPLFGLTIFVITIIGVNLFLLIAFQFYLIYSFAHTVVPWAPPGKSGASLQQYRGNPQVVAAAYPVVALLRRASRTRRSSATLIHGVLLSGMPGSGREFLARAIATEAGVPFGAINARALTAGWFGTDNLKVRMLYRHAQRLARQHGACILFIAEIEALGERSSAPPAATGLHRGISTTSNPLHELLLQIDRQPEQASWWRQMLNLPPRDDRATRPLVLTIGSTCHAERLDGALCYPGRLDYTITLAPPDAHGREELLTAYLEGVPHEPMPIDRMVLETPGATPAALRAMLHEAVYAAQMEGRQAVTYRDFAYARLRAAWSTAQPVATLSHEQQRRIAYHEAGHAYASTRLLAPPHISSITLAAASTAAPPAPPVQTPFAPTTTRQEMLQHIQVVLAGRAAEEELLGVQLAGAAEDLQQATGMAAFMVGRCGMQGSMAASPPAQSSPDATTHQATETLLQEQYRQVRSLIALNREAVTAIAEALMLCHTLTVEDVRQIVAWVETGTALPGSEPALPLLETTTTEETTPDTDTLHG